MLFRTSDRSKRNNVKKGKNVTTAVEHSLKSVVPSHSFLSLIKKRKFSNISWILQDDSVNHAVWLGQREQSPAASKANKSQPPLHSILCYQPDSDVVQLLIDKLVELNIDGQDPLGVQDVLGRTPLHVAAIEGCHASVIQLLITPSFTLDNWNRTPLHWAVLTAAKTTTKTRKNDKYKIFKKKSKNQNALADYEIELNQFEIVHILTKAYPRAVTIRDEKGCIPLDLAIHNGIVDVNHPLHYILNESTKVSNEFKEVQFGKLDLIVVDKTAANDINETENSSLSSSDEITHNEVVVAYTAASNNKKFNIDVSAEISSIGSSNDVSLMKLTTVDAIFA